MAAETVREVVLNFGAKLKNVSLLAPNAVASIDREYRPFVADHLLEAWKKDPKSAPGRLFSSSVPDRIEIALMSPASLSSYAIEANIIETAAGSSGTTTAAVEPVRIIVTNLGGAWKITQFSKGPTAKMN